MENIKIIVIYKVEKNFKDKYTNEKVTENTELEITLERMKELNAKKIGRAIDIKIIELEEKIQETSEENVQDENTKEEKLQAEKLNEMSVQELKELAKSINCELTKAKKSEIIQEILNHK